MVERARPKREPAKPPTPEALRESIKSARERCLKRRHGPPIFMIHEKDGSFRWDWPFKADPAEDEDWKFLIVDAFGTRHSMVAAAFINHLLDVCSHTYDDESQRWIPDEGQVVMLLHIVNAHKPRNEAQAALAAEMAVTHMLLMKVGKRVADYTYDTKMIGAYSNLARTSAFQHEVMANAKGKHRSTSQKITVRQEKHVHQHIHFDHINGGEEQNVRQPDASMGSRADKNADRVAALPGPEEAGRLMSCDGRQGQAGLPNARRKPGIRSAQGQG